VQLDATSRNLHGNAHLAGGRYGEREVRSERAKRKRASHHFEDNQRLIHVGASVRGSTLLTTVKQRQALVETAPKELIQKLMGLYQNESEKVSTKRTEETVSKVEDKKDKHRPPNAIQKVRGVDLPPAVAGWLSFGALGKKIFIPCVKKELEARDVAFEEGTGIKELVKLLREATASSGNDKVFKPKTDIWTAMEEAQT
jgi:hypothetical protein